MYDLILAMSLIVGSNNIFIGKGACESTVHSDCSICLGTDASLPEGARNLLVIGNNKPVHISYIDENIHRAMMQEAVKVNSGLNDFQMKWIEYNWNQACAANLIS